MILPTIHILSSCHSLMNKKFASRECKVAHFKQDCSNESRKFRATRWNESRLYRLDISLFRNVAGPALGLPGDPWLAPPGLLSALPGFLAAPHTGYPSYLTSPRRLPSPPNVGAVANPVPGNDRLRAHLSLFSSLMCPI